MKAGTELWIDKINNGVKAVNFSAQNLCDFLCPVTKSKGPFLGCGCVID